MNNNNSRLSYQSILCLQQGITKTENHVLCSITLSPTRRELAKKLLNLTIIIGVKVQNTFCNEADCWISIVISTFWLLIRWHIVTSISKFFYNVHFNHPLFAGTGNAGVFVKQNSSGEQSHKQFFTPRCHFLRNFPLHSERLSGTSSKRGRSFAREESRRRVEYGWKYLDWHHGFYWTRQRIQKKVCNIIICFSCSFQIV